MNQAAHTQLAAFDSDRNYSLWLIKLYLLLTLDKRAGDHSLGRGPARPVARTSRARDAIVIVQFLYIGDL